MATPYHPKPVDAHSARLDETLCGVLEQLAEKIHDAWAAQRLAEGWQYGPKRDDDRKTHPCLIPYGELPENEKDYDRHTARTALSALLSLGYRIEPPEK
jgi:hypothetical protein